VEEPEGRGTNGEAEGRPEGQDGHERTNGSPVGPASDAGFTEEETLEKNRPVVGEEIGEEIVNRNDLPRRLEVKDRHIRELYDELAAVRLAVDEARAKVEARELQVRDLEEERERLKERLRELEEEERKRRRWREGQDRRVARLEREIERREENIRNLEDRLEEKENERFALDREAEDLTRVEGLERDLEEREEMVVGLTATIEGMRAEMDLEYEMRRRVAGPANRLRAGIDLFNDSEQLQEVASISKSLGQPEVRVDLEKEGAEPPVILTFTWGDVTWRAYAANPGLAVEEPRVYQTGAGEDLSGVHREPSNARIGAGGRVILGL
jgi:hypothetical protein